jgi:hypothetical protein
MNFNEKNKQEWEKVLHELFPSGIPNHCEWTDIDDIVNILNKIGSVESLNHMFYPSGGGMDIESARTSYETDCIEIYTGLTDLLKPKCLIFESFDDNLWSYFRIETEELEPSGVYEELDSSSEELTEINGEYVSRRYWDEGEYKGENLPSSARILTRHLNGSFVIFAKSSYYNKNSRTYDARHNNLTSTEFREYIESVINHGWKDR